MSKPEKKKVTINVADSPILEELDVPSLLKQYHSTHLEHLDASAKANKFETKKKTINASLQVAMAQVGADIVVYKGKEKTWQGTLVSGEPGVKLNEDKLRENLMKMGRLDAKTVTEIFAASEDPVPARASFVRVTIEE